jgi:hypothetical protein
MSTWARLRRLERIAGLDRPDEGPRLRWTPEARAVASEMTALFRRAGAPESGPFGRFMAHPVYGDRLRDLSGRLLDLLAEANPGGDS